MLGIRRSMAIVALFLSAAGILQAQEGTGPVNIRIHRIVFKAGNQYSVNIPDLEFHILLKKQFDLITSSITTDYDFSQKDMGFGMSHVFSKFLVNPGISVDDNLYFREVFSDSTGIWSRRQSISPFLVHEYNNNTTLGMNFIFSREWSPKRREGADIVYNNDYALKLIYYYQTDKKNEWDDTIVSLSAERSFRIFEGQYNYLLLEGRLQFARIINRYIRYKNNTGFSGNVTPQHSPLFFIGGPSTLVGYEKAEFWGRRIVFMQNLFEIDPSPTYTLTVFGKNFRRFSILTQMDIGHVEGAAHIPDLKIQKDDIKIGVGTGFGFVTDIPYMPDTLLHFIVASPLENPSNLKFYAGFGGWLQ
jgi:hypothetical protein